MGLNRELSEEEKLEMNVLERKLKKEFESSLEEDRKELIGKLAAVGDFTEDDIKELLLDAIVDNGVDKEKAKSLLKDIRKKFKSSQAELEEKKRREHVRER